MWRSMDSAPRDNTIIEIKNTYGVMPWFGIFRWASEMDIESFESRDGHTKSLGIKKYPCSPRWVSVNRTGQSLPDETHISWRPYSRSSGVPYVDPTNGAQETDKYWLRR